MNMKIKMRFAAIIVVIVIAICVTVGVAVWRMPGSESDIQTECANTEQASENDSDEESSRDTRVPEEYRDKETHQDNNGNSHIEEILKNMTIEEKAAQLFIVTPETVTGESVLTEIDSSFVNAYKEFPVGGFIMMQENIISPEQITEMNGRLLEIGSETTGVIPFISVDEEGGTVARIASNENFPVYNVGNMSDIGIEGSTQKAYEAASYIGSYLTDYGFNLDFAPDADVWINPENTVVKYRSFSSDPQIASELTAAAVKGFHNGGIWTTLKHFPGHGATVEDSHEGFARSDRNLNELRQCEFLPFEYGIKEKSEFVMVGHISVPEASGENIPASLSETVVSDFLRGELKYDGIIITDAMNMGAISEYYSSSEAAVMAVQAGVDMILMPSDFQAARKGILDAVRDGRILEERLDESVRRILELKAKENF